MSSIGTDEIISFSECSDIECVKCHSVSEEMLKNDEGILLVKNSLLEACNIATPLTKSFSTALKSKQVKKMYKEMISDSEIKALGLKPFLKLIYSEGESNELNHLAYIVSLFDCRGVTKGQFLSPSFSKDPIFQDIRKLLGSDNREHLFAVLMDLKPVVYSLIVDQFPFTELEIFGEFFTLHEIDEALLSSEELKTKFNEDIYTMIKDLSIGDYEIKDFKTVGAVFKTFSMKKYNYEWMLDDIETASKFSEPFDTFISTVNDAIIDGLSSIKSKVMSLCYKARSKLDYAGPGFKPITQAERLSLNSLAQFASTYLASTPKEDEVFFVHRGVLTKLIILIHDKSSSPVTFRGYKHKNGIFIQPIELMYKDSGALSGPELSGFSYEYVLTKDAKNNDSNSINYVFNKFKINNLNFVVQAEIDAMIYDENDDKAIPVELKTISIQKYNTLLTSCQLFLNSWAQNYFLDESALTIVGVKTKKALLESSKVLCQGSLLHQWKQYIGNQANAVSDEEIRSTTNENLAYMFSTVKHYFRKELHHNQVRMFEFCMKADSETGAIKCSQYYSTTYDLSSCEEFADIPDQHVREDLVSLFKNLSEH